MKKKKIGFLINTGLCANPYNGIRMQAEMWADELLRQGIEVIKINPWDKIDWQSFDAVHLIGADIGIYGLLNSLHPRCKKIVFSPIIDTIESVRKYQMASHWGCKKMRLYSVNYSIRESKTFISRWFVRSRYEWQYVEQSYGVPKEQISLIPLSFRMPVCHSYPSKESFVLHVSVLTAGRKNVIRLMKAAIKYNFKLVLAGGMNSQESTYSQIKELLHNKNITYLGRIDDAQLIDLYSRAKVFALPSIDEGVGMVAVEAASYGCDIVVTCKGGPKEYYLDDKGNYMAYVVNPYSVDDIGKAVLKALSENSFQPQLQRRIQERYNLASCVSKLLEEYDK